MLNRKLLAASPCLVAVVLLMAQQARASVSLTGVVPSTTKKYLVSGTSVNVNPSTHQTLKITFETTTSGVNLSLCSGTSANFAAGACGTLLSSSGGPGFTFLTLVDSTTLNYQDLYVIMNVGTVNAGFSLTIE